MLVLVDMYEGFDIIGYYETGKEVKQAKKRWEEETDGECKLAVFLKTPDGKLAQIG